MHRRSFIESFAYSTAALTIGSSFTNNTTGTIKKTETNKGSFLEADVVIAGGGLGGVATALALLRNGHSVILTETTDWLGGQLTSQGVPPDEHEWIENHGAPQSYRELRNKIRDYYRQYYPLTDKERNNPLLNPGSGGVSRLCHEPAVAETVIRQMLAPYISNAKLLLLMEYTAVSASVQGSKVQNLTVRHERSGNRKTIKAPFFVDATELGDLLPITGTAYVTGAESKKQTGELHAPATANPKNNQAFTMCFAMDYLEGADHTIPRPMNYSSWRNHVPPLKPSWSGRLLDLHYSQPKTLERKELGFSPDGKNLEGLLNLWNYRRIIKKENFKEGFYQGDISIVNWPQNDYMIGDIVGAAPETFKKYVNDAKQLSLSLLYWLQTEAPRPDGGKGWPGLRLRKDIMGTTDGLAKYPYVRESRRIKAQFTILEEHVGVDNRKLVAGVTDAHKAAPFFDSVGTGYYHIDLHPSTGGNNYIDFASLPFQIPLGALLPVKMENIFPANKSIGTTHITNGCYRLHPVEWSIGEAVGMLLVFASANRVMPAAVRKDAQLLKNFQEFIKTQGLETHWPENG